MPQDATAYAELGAAYVQQARVSGDPAFYPKAQTALDRSLELKPEDNLPALIGQGALANARHDFAAAAQWGNRAVAVSAFNPDAYAVLTDAYTQLGQPARATAAVQRMLDLQPALPALTRASYDLEQRGDRAGARRLMQRALDDAFTPADVGFCRYYLGELAFNGGELAEATRQYEAGLVADPQSTALLQGRAKVAALRGDTTAALTSYAELVSRVPNPQYVVEYGELLTKLGRTGEAAEQFALVETLHRLFADNGGRDDLSPGRVRGRSRLGRRGGPLRPRRVGPAQECSGRGRAGLGAAPGRPGPRGPGLRGPRGGPGLAQRPVLPAPRRDPPRPGRSRRGRRPTPPASAPTTRASTATLPSFGRPT